MARPCPLDLDLWLSHGSRSNPRPLDPDLWLGRGSRSNLRPLDPDLRLGRSSRSNLQPLDPDLWLGHSSRSNLWPLDPDLWLGRGSRSNLRPLDPDLWLGRGSRSNLWPLDLDLWLGRGSRSNPRPLDLDLWLGHGSRSNLWPLDLDLWLGHGSRSNPRPLDLDLRLGRSSRSNPQSLDLDLRLRSDLDLIHVFVSRSNANILVIGWQQHLCKKQKYLFLAYTAHVEYATAARKGLTSGWYPSPRDGVPLHSLHMLKATPLAACSIFLSLSLDLLVYRCSFSLAISIGIFNHFSHSNFVYCLINQGVLQDRGYSPLGRRESMLAMPRVVSLLWSRRRTFLFLKRIHSHKNAPFKSNRVQLCHIVKNFINTVVFWVCTVGYNHAFLQHKACSKDLYS